MANFRAERIFVMLDSAIPGFDHIKAIDPAELCRACTTTRTDSDLLNLPPLENFTFAAGDRSWEPRQKSRWFHAADGLKSARGLIAYYQAQITKGEGSAAGLPQTALRPLVETLRQLETLLDKADTYDRKFSLAVKDLP